MSCVWSAGPVYFIIVITGVFLSAAVRLLVTRINNAVLKDTETIDWNGCEAVQQMLAYYGIHNVRTEKQEGIFNDRFIPGTRTILMSGVSYASPSLIGIAAALYQGCSAVQNDRAHIGVVLKYLLTFVCRTAALLVTPAIPFMFFFPAVLHMGLMIYSIIIIVNIILTIVEMAGIRYAVDFISSSGRMNTEQMRKIKKMLAAQSMSGIAALFAPISIVINILTDSIRNLGNRLKK